MAEALAAFYLAVGDLFFHLAGVFYRKAGEVWRIGDTDWICAVNERYAAVEIGDTDEVSG